MRVAVMVSLFPAVSETFVLNQLTALLDRGCQVDVYAGCRGDTGIVHPEVEHYGLLSRTHYSPHMPLWKPARAIKAAWLLASHLAQGHAVMLRALNLRRYGRTAGSLELLYATLPLINAKQYDVIYCHFGPNGKRAVMLRDMGLISGRIVTVFHGYDVSRYVQQHGRHAYDELFAQGDLFLPISDHWRARLAELGCDERKIVVHRMGIQPQAFAFVPRKQRTGEPVRLITVARLVPKKGVELAIRAVGQLLRAGRSVEYKIIGDGPLRPHLDHLIRTLGAEGAIKLLRSRPQGEVVETLRGAHIFLAPSLTDETGDQEGIPVSIMEAMASGLPIVSTWHSGIPELVEDSVSGLLAAEGDLDDLSRKLAFLCERPERWEQMGRAGRAFVEEHHDNGRLNSRLFEILQGVTRGANEAA